MTQKVWTKEGLVDNSSEISPDDLRTLQSWKSIHVDCPYCLLRDSMDKFATFTKGTKKYPKKLSLVKMECPECGQGMMWKTLRKCTLMTVDEFAWWFWENVFCYKMMERVKTEAFFSRIKEWAYEDRQIFWNVYKWYKNADDKKSVRKDYEDYLDYTERLKEEEDEDKFDT